MRKMTVRSEGGTEWNLAAAWNGLIFNSGEVGADPLTGNPVPGGVEAQIQQTFKNIAATLSEVGSSLEHVLKVTAYLGHERHYGAWETGFDETFPHDPPARTTLVATLLGEFDVEVDVVAYSPQR